MDVRFLMVKSQLFRLHYAAMGLQDMAISSLQSDIISMNSMVNASRRRMTDKNDLTMMVNKHQEAGFGKCPMA